MNFCFLFSGSHHSEQTRSVGGGGAGNAGQRQNEDNEAVENPGGGRVSESVASCFVATSKGKFVSTLGKPQRLHNFSLFAFRLCGKRHFQRSQDRQEQETRPRLTSALPPVSQLRITSNESCRAETRAAAKPVVLKKNWFCERSQPTNHAESAFPLNLLPQFASKIIFLVVWPMNFVAVSSSSCWDRPGTAVGLHVTTSLASGADSGSSGWHCNSNQLTCQPVAHVVPSLAMDTFLLGFQGARVNSSPWIGHHSRTRLATSYELWKSNYFLPSTDEYCNSSVAVYSLTCSIHIDADRNEIHCPSCCCCFQREEGRDSASLDRFWNQICHNLDAKPDSATQYQPV